MPLDILTTADLAKARNKLELNRIIAAELNAGLLSSDINTSYPVGHIYRYVTNTTPGTTDVTTQLQAWLDLGGTVDLYAPVNDIFRVTAQLIIRSGTTLLMGPDCVILRDWGGTAGSKHTNAQFSNEHAPDMSDIIVDPGPWTPSTTDDNIYIEGGRIRPVDNTCIGVGYYLMGTKNLTMRNPVVERTHQDWAFCVGGENFSITGVRVEENAEVFEDGVHILYGSGRVDADYIHSGDDCFAVGSSWNLPVDDVDITMGNFHSEKGFAIKMLQAREGASAGFSTPTSVIQDVRFHSGSGKAGYARNGLVQTFAAAADLLMDITIDGVKIDAGTGTHDGTNPYGVYFQDITRLRVKNLTAKNARRDAFYLKNCPGFELDGCIARDSQGTSSFRALVVEDCVGGRIIGGDYLRTLTHPVRLLGTSSVSFHGPRIRGIGNGLAGINAEGTADVSLNGVIFEKAAGATSSHGLRVGSTSVSVTADGCIWNVDRPLQTPSAPRYARLSKVRRTVTIAGGAATTYGDDLIELLCEGGVADSLTTLNGAFKGQVVTLVNGEASPGTAVVTLTAGSGSNALNIGANVALDSATSRVTLEFNGTNWVRANLPVRAGAYTQTYATADKTLGAYTSDTESVAYIGSPADAASTAKLADLNALRVAYENVRAHHEDLAQFVNSLVTDLKGLGLIQ